MWRLPERISFTSAHARTLQKLQITERVPGTVLHDFEVLLAYLQDQPLPLTAGHQLPRDILPQINARLAHPIRIDLKRPLQKSFPPIHGLYLLLRASGLTYVGGTAKKPLLFLDADLYQEWLALNSTERYAALLEAWLLRGQPEIIGEPGRLAAIPENYWQSLHFSMWIPDQGKQIRGDKDAEEILPFPAEWHNLGLLELFGFIAVVAGPPDPGRGRRIDRISRTPVGDALLALLGERFFGDLKRIHEIEATGTVPPGLLQPILQPYLPQCQRTLAMPEWAFRQGTHIFDMQLGQLRSRLALPAHATLDDLASTILHVLHFTSDHLYEFTYKNRLGVEEHVVHPFMDERPRTSETEIGQLPLAEGQTMLFVYDFGDWWQILLTLEAVAPATALNKPQILETKGTPPIQYPDYYGE